MSNFLFLGAPSFNFLLKILWMYASSPLHPCQSLLDAMFWSLQSEGSSGASPSHVLTGHTCHVCSIQYGVPLEKVTYQFSTADFVYMLLFGMVSLLVRYKFCHHCAEAHGLCGGNAMKHPLGRSGACNAASGPLESAICHVSGSDLSAD